MTTSWHQLNQQIVACDACPRLRAHCHEIAQVKRRAYQSWDYWGRPVPNFGSASAPLLIVGLAPAAHGANRTGRMFTGDRSGDWLFRALYRAGFATQPHATEMSDGLKLKRCAITAICHCAPPGNKPTTTEKQQCHRWLSATLDMMQPRVFLTLGKIAWDGLWPELARRYFASRGGDFATKVEGDGRPRKARPKFGHAAEVTLPGKRLLLGCYHPSQQNTFTGRLTEAMLDDVMGRIDAYLTPSASKSSASK